MASKRTPAERFVTYVNLDGPVPEHRPDLGPCHLWTGATNDKGYGYFRWEGRMRSAHVVALLIAGVVMPPGECGLHHCDNPPCVNLGHLFIGTHAANAADRNAKGRQVHGDRCHMAKLSAADVHTIRERAAAGATLAELADEYPVHRETIRAVVKRKTWANV